MGDLNQRALLLILGLVFLLWPVDLVPDPFGLLGRIDDLLVLGFVMWKLWKTRYVSDEGPSREDRERHTAREQGHENRQSSQSPYEVLGVSPTTATPEEIDARYRMLAKQYHPDRVAHLGPELRELAHEKMIEIQRAYSALTSRRANAG